jgi:hypothetical protein
LNASAVGKSRNGISRRKPPLEKMAAAERDENQRRQCRIAEKSRIKIFLFHLKHYLIIMLHDYFFKVVAQYSEMKKVDIYI